MRELIFIFFRLVGINSHQDDTEDISQRFESNTITAQTCYDIETIIDIIENRRYHSHILLVLLQLFPCSVALPREALREILCINCDEIVRRLAGAPCRGIFAAQQDTLDRVTRLTHFVHSVILASDDNRSILFLEETPILTIHDFHLERIYPVGDTNILISRDNDNYRIVVVPAQRVTRNLR